MSDSNLRNWTFSKCDCGDPVCKRYFMSFTGGDGRVDLDEARLACAAPELLEALEESIREMEHHDSGAKQLFFNVIPKARAAIAKAEGKQ